MKKGEWCFVFLPAQLLAMVNDDSHFFESGFWNAHSVSNNRKERQREALRVLETRCEQHHFSQKAQPIRYIGYQA